MSAAAEPADVDADEPAPRGPMPAAVKEAAALSAKLARRGVAYLSRLPPFMKPAKLRHLLAPHGEVLRIYLAAEGV